MHFNGFRHIKTHPQILGFAINPRLTKGGGVKLSPVCFSLIQVFFTTNVLCQPIGNSVSHILMYTLCRYLIPSFTCNDLSSKIQSVTA
jgi:hypothetical protein